MEGSPQHPRFFSPELEIQCGFNRLPHWNQDGRCYAVTFRLFDSIPAPVLKAHRLAEQEWLALHPRPWSNTVELEHIKTFRGPFEKWLDQGHGECLLRTREWATIVANALRFFEGARTILHAWVVMPNHVHVLMEILEGWNLPGMMHSWKSFTASRLNEGMGRVGAVWQKGYHDRLIRDWNHFGNVVRYIRRNPQKAGLGDGEYLCGESELAAAF